MDVKERIVPEKPPTVGGKTAWHDYQKQFEANVTRLVRFAYRTASQDLIE